MTALFLYFTLAFSDGRWTQLGPFPTLAICQERMAPFERAQAGEAEYGVSQCYASPRLPGARAESPGVGGTSPWTNEGKPDVTRTH
jgi:hypothetical protein